MLKQNERVVVTNVDPNSSRQDKWIGECGTVHRQIGGEMSKIWSVKMDQTGEFEAFEVHNLKRTTDARY